MVNIISAAKAAVSAYGAAIALGGNYSVPLPELASQVSAFYLPNCTAFTLGQITVIPDQTIMAEGFTTLYTEWRENGPGTVVTLSRSRIELVSEGSALCWLTYRICPQTAGVEGWHWTNVYGFRLVEGGMENGLQGGWEFVVSDNEQQEYAKRYGGE